MGFEAKVKYFLTGFTGLEGVRERLFSGFCRADGTFRLFQTIFTLS